MRDLVRLTGISAPTIHFYAQQGLLPAAEKTADNQARYSDDTVHRLRWIRSLQELRFSLRAIRSILERHGELPVEEVSALQTLGSLLDEPDPLASGEELAAIRERVDARDLDALSRLGLVRTSGGAVSSSDMRLIELVAAIRGAGFTEQAGFNIDNLALYRDAVEELVNSELARIIEPVLVKHDPETLRDLVRRGLPLADQLLTLLHRRAVQSELRRWLEVDASEAQPVSA
jgi:DNA-binding transcriptional MerR regulator